MDVHGTRDTLEETSDRELRQKDDNNQRIICSRINMSKINKKRKLLEAQSDLFRLSGTSTTEATSVDDCLQELEGFASPPRTEATLQPPINHTSQSASERGDFDRMIPGHAPQYYRSQLRNRVQEWNNSFALVAKKGEYTFGLFPSFEVELARHFQIKELSKFLLQTGLKMPSFERWLLDSKIDEMLSGETPLDPVLSGAISEDHPSSKRLIQELTEYLPEKDKDAELSAKNIIRELCRRTLTTAIPEIQSQVRRCALQTPLKNEKIEIEFHVKDNRSHVSLQFSRKKWKKPFVIKLNTSHYDKLRDMFSRIHCMDDAFKFDMTGSNTQVKKEKHVFHLIVMVLLLRYSSLSGGQLLDDLRGGGMQGAIHSEVFQVLGTFFESTTVHECFASPFNAHLPFFNSAFSKDLDWHFGSTGDFFTGQLPKDGCLEANPPFSPGLMDAMVNRMENTFLDADQSDTSLTYVIVVPTFRSKESLPQAKKFAKASFTRMVTSKYCRLHIILSAQSHGYVEGAQHLRPTRFKDSTYDTSVIVLQSKRARNQDLDEKSFEEEMRVAFASRHKEEIRDRVNLQQLDSSS